MKITGQNVGNSLKGIESAQTQKPEKSGVEKSKADSAAIASSSTVSLSGRAQDIKKAKDIASKDMNSVDEAKVARLQALIDSGKYKVDSEAIADKLVDEHLIFPD